MIGDNKEGPIWVCIDCCRLHYWDEAKVFEKGGCLNPDCGGHDLVRISWMREFLRLLDSGFYETRSSASKVNKDG